MNTTANPRRSAGEKTETFLLVLILLLVAVAAGAASFTHVHDWTMRNSPDGTGSWFGWANAVISELVPVASMLVMRRRKQTGQPIGYPIFLLGAALILSVTAQLAVAKPTFFGGLVSVIPALAFAALAKLVLGKTPVPTAVPVTPVSVPAVPAPVPAVPTVPVPAEPTPAPVDAPAKIPAPVVTPEPAMQPEPTPAPTAAAASSWPSPALPAELLDRARRIVTEHQQTNEVPITRDELRALLRVSNATTGDVMRALGLAPSRTVPAVPATANGHAVPVLADGLF